MSYRNHENPNEIYKSLSINIMTNPEIAERKIIWKIVLTACRL
jgi:hypothetical protein